MNESNDATEQPNEPAEPVESTTEDAAQTAPAPEEPEDLGPQSLKVRPGDHPVVVVGKAIASLKLTVTLFALLLAGIGIYGVIAQEVEERRGEMGVRMAMGASPGSAVLTTAGDGLGVAALGLALGLGLSILAGRFLESLVWGVPSWDAVSLLSVTVTLGAAAAAAFASAGGGGLASLAP